MSETTGVKARRSGPRRAWIADDDRGVRDVVSFALQDAGFEVRAFRSGSELLDALEASDQASGAAEVVFVDLRMPGPSGLDVLHAMKSAGWVLPAVLMTGFADPDTVLAAAALGVPLLEKPFGIRAIAQAAALALGEEAGDAAGPSKVPA